MSAKKKTKPGPGPTAREIRLRQVTDLIDTVIQLSPTEAIWLCGEISDYLDATVDALREDEKRNQ